MEHRERLERELGQTARRLRALGRAETLGECPEAIGGPVTDLLDEVEVLEGRELLFATRGRLVERLTRLGAALERVRAGRYGLCEECEEPIAPARLSALPEAATCVLCQDRRERRARALRAVAARTEAEW